MTRCIDCGGEIIEGEDHRCHTGGRVNTRAIVRDLRERERWVRELFSNPNVTRLHKLVLVALIWCAADQGLPDMRRVGVTLSELASMLGEEEEDVREALHDLRKAGVLHKVDV